MKEYDFGIKHEKSALANFAEKYVIDGEPNMKPLKYFQVKVPQLNNFFKNHRIIIKVRLLMMSFRESTY